MHINCDMGESYGTFIKGNDEAIMPYINACNIACGFHAGDPVHMQRTIQLAKAHNLEIGAHPGFQDLQGFGRRIMKLSEEELTAILIYQIGALEKMANAASVQMHHIKVHGALNNLAARDELTARVIANVALSHFPEAYLYVPVNSVQSKIAQELGIKYKIEAFIDRKYASDYQLASRSIQGSVIHDPKMASDQFFLMNKHHQVVNIDGETMPLQADTFCIHGDNPNAVDILKAIHQST